MSAVPNRKRSFTLKQIPKDVWDIMIDQQADFKKTCDCNYSLERTVFKIIRASKDFKFID
jgi:Tfp pilus assembly ATPase PilU